MDQWNHMGIDVSAKTLDVALEGEGALVHEWLIVFTPRG
jgi:hypothetical protein